MSANCGVCGDPCVDEKSSVKCTGGCDVTFHLSCIKPDGGRTRGFSKDWKCESCAPKKDNSSTSSAKSSTTAVTKQFLISTLESFKKDVFEELKSYSQQFQEIKDAVQFHSDAVDKANQLVDKMEKELEKVVKEVGGLKEENRLLRGTVNTLQDKVRSLEQYSRRTNLEVSGIPESPREDVLSLIKDVGTAIGQELKESEVMAVHRIPSFKKDRAPSLIVQFLTKMQRDAWISDFRKKKTLTANEVNPAFPKNRVYLSEHLSPDNKVFLGQLKEACRRENIKYVWYRDGKFYVRRQDGGRCHKVSSLTELSKLR